MTDRPPLILTVVIVFIGGIGMWLAFSRELEGFSVYSDTREKAEAAVRQILEPWIGDHVTLQFRDA